MVAINIIAGIGLVFLTREQAKKINNMALYPIAKGREGRHKVREPKFPSFGRV